MHYRMFPSEELLRSHARLIDQYDPDLSILMIRYFPWLGWDEIGAYHYNNSLKNNGGKMEGILNVKEIPDRWSKQWFPTTRA